MAELLQSGQGPDGAGKAAANSLNALLKKSKKPAVRNAVGQGPGGAATAAVMGSRAWPGSWQGLLFRPASCARKQGVAAATHPATHCP